MSENVLPGIEEAIRNLRKIEQEALTQKKAFLASVRKMLLQLAKTPGVIAPFTLFIQRTDDISLWEKCLFHLCNKTPADFIHYLNGVGVDFGEGDQRVRFYDFPSQKVAEACLQSLNVPYKQKD